MAEPTGPLAGVRVIDASTLFAGPLAATFLGDLGADVVKIEHPARPDAARTHGPARNGVGLWWKTLGRNKRTATLDLSRPEGAALMLRLAERADVLIENFRPGTLERWGLGPNEVHGANPRLVMARVTAFGQFGPLATQPGFGSIAEAMSGFAAITGEPDGPPTLPPFGLADGIAALATSFAVTAALRSAEATGRGQVVDVAIIEPILMLLGAQITTYDQLGSCSSASATAPPTTPRATSTARPTASGSPSARRRSRSPSESFVSSAVPTLSSSRGSRPAVSGPSTPTSSTMQSPRGSRRVRPPRCWPRSKQPKQRSGRSTTCAA